jgi:hypothetical protein
MKQWHLIAKTQSPTPRRYENFTTKNGGRISVGIDSIHDDGPGRFEKKDINTSGRKRL